MKYTEERIVYKDTHADYEALLKLDNAVSIHQRNLQHFMTEIYKNHGHCSSTQKCKQKSLNYLLSLYIIYPYNYQRLPHREWGVTLHTPSSASPWLHSLKLRIPKRISTFKNFKVRSTRILTKSFGADALP